MKKSFIMALALVLVLGIAIGGTVAWLTASTDPVTNTFTVGDIDIELKETKKPDGTENADKSAVTNWSAQLVPGKEYTKNPVVSVEASTNVDVYLFVKFEENNNPSNYLTYTSTLNDTNNWKQGKGEKTTENPDGDGIPKNVWYREVKIGDTTKSWRLLDGDKVTVKDTLTKDNMPAANATPVLKYTAAAIQMDGFDTAADAWEELPAEFTGATTTNP